MGTSLHCRNLAQYYPECQSDCNCTESAVFPVCNERLGISFISPCHAGCKGYTEINEVSLGMKQLHIHQSLLLPGKWLIPFLSLWLSLWPFPMFLSLSLSLSPSLDLCAILFSVLRNVATRSIKLKIRRKFHKSGL